jgi:aconitate hydratase
MSYRSNIPAIAEFTFRHRDPEFRGRLKEWGEGFIVGGDNYGQGSSREHAALAPLQLGVKAVFAKSFARIHRRNLVAQGILALLFKADADYDRAEVGQTWSLPNVKQELERGSEDLTVRIEESGETFTVTHDFAPTEREMLVLGGLLNYLKEKGERVGGNGARPNAKAAGVGQDREQEGEAVEEGVGGQSESGTEIIDVEECA